MRSWGKQVPEGGILFPSSTRSYRPVCVVVSSDCCCTYAEAGMVINIFCIRSKLCISFFVSYLLFHNLTTFILSFFRVGVHDLLYSTACR